MDQDDIMIFQFFIFLFFFKFNDFFNSNEVEKKGKLINEYNY